MSAPRQRTQEAPGGALGFGHNNQWWATEGEVDGGGSARPDSGADRM
jgi:hypothetical protein